MSVRHAKTALLMFWALALPSGFLAACFHPARRPVMPVAVETRLGTVRAIGAEQRFVLIEASSALVASAVSEGQLLHCRPPFTLTRTSTADLRVSRERHESLIVANVVAGNPALGDLVYATPPGAAPVPRPHARPDLRRPRRSPPRPLRTPQPMNPPPGSSVQLRAEMLSETDARARILAGIDPLPAETRAPGLCPRPLQRRRNHLPATPSPRSTILPWTATPCPPPTWRNRCAPALSLPSRANNPPGRTAVCASTPARPCAFSPARPFPPTRARSSCRRMSTATANASSCVTPSPLAKTFVVRARTSPAASGSLRGAFR